MAVNYIQGQILASTLERDGIDLSIANANVGIGTVPSARLDVYGNVRVGNVLISNIGTVSAVGNITGGNLIAINFVRANTATITGNLAAGNVLTDHLLYANGTPWDLQEPAGANTEIQFNNNSQFGATANFTFNTAANLLTVNATANIANLGVQGNVTGGNLSTGGLVSATGNVTAGNIRTAGNVYASNFVGNISGNIASPGANTQVIFNDNGTANAVAGFTFNKTSNAVAITGNISGANLLTIGIVSSTGNITDEANIVGGNLITSVVILATANITGGNLIIGSKFIPSSGNINAGSVNINNVTDPVANQDAATKYYVDQSIANIAVTNQTLNGDGTTVAFTLNRSTTTAAALIMLNGITQVPNQSYAMTPSPSTNLVFTEAPGTGDLIDIRFL
jgi:hypothetical protein